MIASWSYSIGTSSGSKESEPVPSGSEIAISDNDLVRNWGCGVAGIWDDRARASFV